MSIAGSDGAVRNGTLRRRMKALVGRLGRIDVYRLPMLPPPDFVEVDPDELPSDET